MSFLMGVCLGAKWAAAVLFPVLLVATLVVLIIQLCQRSCTWKFGWLWPIWIAWLCAEIAAILSSGAISAIISSCAPRPAPRFPYACATSLNLAFQ